MSQPTSLSKQTGWCQVSRNNASFYDLLQSSPFQKLEVDFVYNSYAIVPLVSPDPDQDFCSCPSDLIFHDSVKRVIPLKMCTFFPTFCEFSEKYHNAAHVLTWSQEMKRRWQSAMHSRIKIPKSLSVECSRKVNLSVINASQHGTEILDQHSKT